MSALIKKRPTPKSFSNNLWEAGETDNNCCAMKPF
jgi:hypothetical protein